MPRTKGSLNKRTAGLLEEVRRVYPDYDPVIELIKIAKGPEVGPKPTISEQIQCHTAAAKYLRRQLKSVELTGEDGGALRHVISADPMTLEQWEEAHSSDASDI